MTDVVEAMARGMIAAGCPVGFAHDLARAAIRAVTERGGLVVGKMPGPFDIPGSVSLPNHLTAGQMVHLCRVGWNNAIDEVRAAAVEVV